MRCGISFAHNILVTLNSRVIKSRMLQIQVSCVHPNNRVAQIHYARNTIRSTITYRAHEF